MENFIYYLMDVDDNIVHLDCPIYLFNRVTGEKRKITTREYAILKRDPNWFYNDQSWLEFRQIRAEKFLEKFRATLQQGNVALSYHSLKKALIEGRLISFITARDLDEETLRQSLILFNELELTADEKEQQLLNLKKWSQIFKTNIDDQSLLQHYWGNCEFIGVTNRECIQKWQLEGLDIHEAKSKVVKTIVEQFFHKLHVKFEIENSNMEIGFSDDDVDNIEEIKNLFKQIKNQYPIKFHVYNTQGPEIIKEEI